MKSPAMKMLMDAAILITAVCAIHEGLTAFGFDLTAPGSMLGGVSEWVKYLFGAAGVFSLAMFFLSCHCAHESCACK